MYDKPKHERSLLITVISPLLFLAPEGHLREMERLSADELVIKVVWRAHMTVLLGEWGDTILWVCIQRNLIDSCISRDCYLVNSAADGQRRLSCYPWRSPFKS